MTYAAEQHKELERKLFSLRSANTLTEEEDDRLLEEMADLWWEMDDDEQQAFRERAEAWARGEPVILAISNSSEELTSVANSEPSTTQAFKYFGIAAAATLCLSLQISGAASAFPGASHETPLSSNASNKIDKTPVEAGAAPDTDA